MRERARRRVGVLTAWAIFALAGCLASSGDSDRDPSPNDPPPGEDVDKAFFILQQSDLASPGWPAAYAEYSVFVCNPSLTADELAVVRAGVPGATLLAYTNVQDIPITNHVGNPYYDALAAAFPPSYCIRDMNTQQIVKIYGYGTPEAVPAWIVRPESADALVAFHQNVTMQVPWDGFYIDQCNAAYPNHRKATLLSITDRFDIDANGIADSMQLLEVWYAQYRPYFTEKMREAFPGAVLVANSGGALNDSALNGITLEGVGERFTVEQARSILGSQRGVAVEPFRAVLWSTTEASADPSWSLAEELDGVCFGVVDSGTNVQKLRIPTLQRQHLPPDRLKDPGSRVNRALDD